MLFPPLHGAADGPFLTAWAFDPLVVFGLLAAAAGYAFGLHRLRETRQPEWPVRYSVFFFAGLAFTALALLGPIDTFNDEAFFLHMIQHIVLMDVAAPLLLLGRPVQLALKTIPRRHSKTVFRTMIRPRTVRGVLTFLTLPVVVALAYNGTLAAWHMPGMYVAALENGFVHEVMHATMLGAGLLFWWVIIDPVPRHHKAGTATMLALIASTMLTGKIIGALLTFADSVVYSFYQGVEQPWGLTPLVDQQIAGIIMLVGVGILAGVLFYIVLVRALLATADPPYQPRPQPVPRDQRPATQEAD